MWKYLTLDGVFQGGRSFFGAISVPYLISKGLVLSDIATLKLVQSFVVSILELPTGYVSDRLGHGAAILSATVFGLLSFLAYYFGNSFWDFAAAEVLLATGLSFWSGAYDALAINSLKIGNDRVALSTFYHRKSATSNASIMLCGFLGGIVASTALGLPYILSTFSFALLGSWIISSFLFGDRKKDEEEKVNQSLVLLVRTELSKMGSSFRTAVTAIHSKEMVRLTLGFIVLEMVIQPLIFYWQPWFQSFVPANAPVTLASLYVWIQLVIICSGLFFAKIANRSFTSTPVFWALTWVTYSIASIALSQSANIFAAIAIFTLMEACFTVGENSMKAELNHNIPNDLRASYLSIVSLMSKLSGGLALLAMKFVIQNLQQSDQSIGYCFFGLGVLGLLYFGWSGLTSSQESSSSAVIIAERRRSS